MKKLTLFILILTLATASIAKFGKPWQLESFVSASHLAPQMFAKSMAWAIILAEALAALLLIVPRTRVVGLYSSASLFSLFAGFSIWRLYQGISVPCTCFGSLLVMTPTQAFLVSAVLLLLSVNAILAPRK